MNKTRYAFYLSLSLLLCCKKPYNPPASSSPNSYLVVEGIINSGNDSTVIKISKTVVLTSQTANNPLVGATVTVEGELNGIYTLTDINNNGHYNSRTGLNLSSTQRYRLRIKTNNQEYLSDYEAVKITPPIDSVGFAVQSNGIQLYLNTHDPGNNTRYYRWEYEQTWQFHSFYQSFYYSDGKEMRYRTPAQQDYYCFGNDTSGAVLLGSSAKLASDVIYQSPLTQIFSNSEKVQTKYSILVKQYALTAGAYQFWEILKSNSEQLGSIFSPQPSELNGNIHCITNPSEPVIGYISIGTVQQKRIFITNAQLPQTWRPDRPTDCYLDTLLYDDRGQNDVLLFLIPPGSTYRATVPVPGSGGAIAGFFGAPEQCTDCTLTGTTTKPPFWR